MIFRPILLLLALILTARADLEATFTRDGTSDTRLDRFPALNIQAGESATPFIAPGQFQAVWKGKLVIASRKRLVFSFEGEGAASLKIEGKEVLKREGLLAGEASASTRLNPGEHEFELSYTSKSDGTAEFRLYWEEASFPRQTIPPSAFKSAPGEPAKLGELQRSGRVIFAQQNCVKCHVPGAGLGSTPMPEIAEIAPILFGIGDRVTEEWLRRWIAGPKELKSTTHMPTLIDAKTPEGAQQVSDLAAYLAGLKLGAPTGSAPDPALAQEGGVHFHELGCVGCHNIPDKGTTDPSRVPLNNVASKFIPGALFSYLKKPDTHSPFTAMPDFRLSDAEANSLAAYLIQASTGQQTKVATTFPAGDAQRGAKVAEAMQCGVCHPGMQMSSITLHQSLEIIFTKAWGETGCAALPEKRGKSPVLNLSETDRKALEAFAESGADSLRRDTSGEYAKRQIEALRCTACHGLDDRQPLLNSIHAETQLLTAHLPKLNERVDQTRPQLTFIGEMLHTSAIESMIAGSTNPRPRPWLAMRMPSFRVHAAPLAVGLSKLHGVGQNKPEEIKTDPALVEIGKSLVGPAGFGCTTCHAIGDEKPTAAFEVEGVNFKLVPSRIRQDYFRRWMDNPKSITPSTKMPRYAEDNKSQRTDILGGDAQKQYEAIWHYLNSK